MPAKWSIVKEGQWLLWFYQQGVLRKSECLRGGNVNQRRRFLRKCVNLSNQIRGFCQELRVKCAGFRSICAGFLSRNRSNVQVFEANTQVFVNKSAKIGKNLQKLTEIYKNSQKFTKINKNAPFLNMFFIPPRANCSKRRIRISYFVLRISHVVKRMMWGQNLDGRRKEYRISNKEYRMSKRRGVRRQESGVRRQKGEGAVEFRVEDFLEMFCTE